MFDTYLPVVDEALIFDNWEGKHELIAKKINKSDVKDLNSLTRDFLQKRKQKTASWLFFATIKSLRLNRDIKLLTP